MWDMKCPLPCSASFVTITLGAPVVVLGLIEGLADGLAGLARFAGGALADDASRRRTVALGGYSLTALLAALIGGAYAIWQVALLRMATWTAGGFASLHAMPCLRIWFLPKSTDGPTALNA